jgi:hypothetical protein
LTALGFTIPSCGYVSFLNLFTLHGPLLLLVYYYKLLY